MTTFIERSEEHSGFIIGSVYFFYLVNKISNMKSALIIAYNIVSYHLEIWTKMVL